MKLSLLFYRNLRQIKGKFYSWAKFFLSFFLQGKKVCVSLGLRTAIMASMIIPTGKRSLSNEEKGQFGSGPEDKLYEFTLEKVIEERCDEFDEQLDLQGMEIVHRDYRPIAASIFNYTVIAKKI